MIAVDYAQQVVDGEIVAGKLIKQAAKRFLDDLKRQGDDDFPFHFDSERAKKVVAFIEALPQTNGAPLKLEPFEVFILSNIYGWRQDDGSLRFNRVLISEARKNGKSFLLASIGVIALLMEKNPQRGRQILFTANSAQQAHLAFDIMADQLAAIRSKSPYVRHRVKIGKQRIDDLESNSFAIPLATDKHTTDGYNPTLGIVDEYHQARDDSILNALKSGMIQQDNGLLAIISTAGFNLHSPFKQEVDYVADILAGKIKNERYFAAIYSLDSPEELDNEDAWIKANPLMSNPKIAKTMADKIRNDIEVAKKNGSLNNVLVKNMNLFVQQSEDSFLTTQEWDIGRVEKAPDLYGRDAYIGVDLSKRGDLTAVSWLIPTGGGKFYVDSHAFVGTHGGLEQKSKTDGVDYQSLAQRGECSISTLDSGVIDYDSVFTYVKDYVDKHHLRVKYLCYDPWNWKELLGRFEKEGYPQFEVKQSRKDLAIPIKTLKEEVIKGNLLHTNNKLLSYHVANAIVKYDTWGNPLLDKTRNANKIDMIASLLTAFTVGMDYYNSEEANQAKNDYYTSKTFSF